MTDIHIKNYDSGNTPEPNQQTWTTGQLQEDFEVLGFLAPIVAVRRKSDGVRGSLEFRHENRIYWNFVPDHEEKES